MTGIELTLQALTRIAWQNRLDPAVYQLARRLTDPEASRQKKMEAIVAELHRHAVRIPAPTDTETFATPFMADPGVDRAPLDTDAVVVPFDADDACLFVASAAMSVGIRCRLIGARYGQSWTCWIAYEVGDHWEIIDPLRQRSERRDPDEQVMGPLPDERRPYAAPTITRLSPDDPRVQSALRKLVTE